MASRRFRLDPFLLLIIGTATFAFILPATGTAADALGWVSKAAIFLLFFGYGARLSVAESLAGLKHWRLHVVILSFTYLAFPLLAVLVLAIPETVLAPSMRLGIIFLCLVPSTVQASITFTSIAGGNIAGAMVSATTSNILGVIITPLLALIFLPAHGGSVQLGQIGDVIVQLLLPFVLGQLSRPLTAAFMDRHRSRLKYLDRLVIALVVYRAYSGFFSERSWELVRASDFVVMALVCWVILAFMLWLTWTLAHRLKFNRADCIAIMFCGTKKSLVTGVPIAAIIFSGQPVGLIVLPLMVFHQSQLMASSAIAGNLARSATSSTATD